MVAKRKLSTPTACFADTASTVLRSRYQFLPAASFDLDLLVLPIHEADGWKAESTNLKLFREDCKPVDVPPQQLDKIAALAAKEKKRAAVWVMLELRSHQCEQAIEALAHIDRLAANKNSGCGCKAEHWINLRSPDHQNVSRQHLHKNTQGQDEYRSGSIAIFEGAAGHLISARLSMKHTGWLACCSKPVNV